MVVTDEDALICDLAETYKIFNWREYPLTLVATLAFGLSDDSRIKRKMSGQKVPMETILLATIADRLSIMIWRQTKDGQNGTNPPTMLLEKILADPSEQQEEQPEGYDSIEAFLEARDKILGG